MTAAAFAEAVAGRDPQRLATHLTDTVRLRALLPTGAVECHGMRDVAAFLPALLADFETVDVLGSAEEPVGDRLLLHYRLGLGRAGARFVCTQTAVCKIVDARLAVVDLLCSGYRRVTDEQ